MKIKKTSLTTIGYFIFFAYCIFVDLFDAIVGQKICLAVWSVVLILLILGTSKITVNKNKIIVVIIISALIIYNNKGINHGNIMSTLRFFFFLVIVFFVMNSFDSYERIIKMIAVFGLVHVLATYLFFIFPSLYNNMYNIWGYWPGGTKHGLNGYKAALSDHYSGNGIIIAITYLALFAYVMSNSGIKKRKRETIVLFIIAFFAVFLTTKRAHLLFGVAAMLLVYYFCNPAKLKSKSFKIIIFISFLLLLLPLIEENVPVIKDTLDRFEDVDEDSHMVSRYRFWLLALQMFKNKPILGNGWMSFRYEYFYHFYSGRANAKLYMNAHNIYIQLLAEVGIVGIIVFTLLVVYLLISVFKTLWIYNQRIIDEKKVLSPLYFSALFLVFFLQYGLTGNCLYDKTSP